ncbi:MAG: molybdopterin-binding protein, partial [Bythopirellula sp.]
MTDPYTSDSAAEHREKSLGKVACAVITVSDTRTIDNDQSGQTVVEALQQAGHTVVQREILPDEPQPMHE